MPVMKKTKSSQTEKIFKLHEINTCWILDKKITYHGKNYRVGKMSYGQFFLEPGKDRGETEPFNKGTLWLERIDKKTFKIE